MPLPSSIAIDGPVASGKSAVGRQLAAKLGYLYFDTGVMYRAVTYLALRAHGVAEDQPRVQAVAESAHLSLTPPTQDDGRDCTVTADGEDITWAVRGKEVENNVSRVAAMPAVRQVLTAQMRAVGLRGRVVMLGRDVGTVILPEADLKIYLTANVETRARRRFAEEQARGGGRSHDEILVNLRERDRIDSSRALAPLRPAVDAVQLDTTDLDLPAVLAAIEQIIVMHSG